MESEGVSPVTRTFLYIVYVALIVALGFGIYHGSRTKTPAPKSVTQAQQKQSTTTTPAPASTPKSSSSSNGSSSTGSQSSSSGTNTSKQLVNTGPGEVVAIFAVSSLGGVVWYQTRLRKSRA